MATEAEPPVHSFIDFETEHITVEGPISVVPVDEVPVAPVRGLPFGSPEVMAYGYFVLLVGPTGSGKSSFIEALCDTELGISKDQLEGMTQSVQAYQVTNATWVNGDNIYLVDTPGFADEKISETRLFRSIREWMKQMKIETIHRILYFDRITDIRMSSSRWRSIETLIQAIQGFDKTSAGDVNTLAITHVTTMWDTVSNDNQQCKVEVRFEELRASISEWHALPDTALHLSKFHNTRSSAISVIDFHDVILIRGWRKWEPFQSTRNFTPDDMRHNAPSNRRFGSFLYRTLMDRIRVTNEQLEMNKDEIKNAKAGRDVVDFGALMEQRKEMVDNLQQLQLDREEFGDNPPDVNTEAPLDQPPSPPPTEPPTPPLLRWTSQDGETFTAPERTPNHHSIKPSAGREEETDETDDTPIARSTTVPLVAFNDTPKSAIHKVPSRRSVGKLLRTVSMRLGRILDPRRDTLDRRVQETLK